LGFKRLGRIKGCGNLKSYPGELIDAIIYGRDLGQDDDFVSEERFDKIRFYLKNGKYPNGADRAEKSRLRSAATHYKLYTATGSEPERLMLKGKEVISDPQRQYEIARELHHKSHGGINKTTASIAESYHWVRIKETVSQVIRNCPECSEMNKGLSAVRAQQSRYVQSDSPGHMPAPTPVQHFPLQPRSLERADSPSNQLQLEAAQHHGQFANFHGQHNNYHMPVDPALMDGMQPRSTSLEDLPPSPFLAAGQSINQDLPVQDIPNINLPTQNLPDMPPLGEDSNMSGTGERAPTASMELRRRLTRAGFSRGQ
jgi:hypothetical protein